MKIYKIFLLMVSILLINIIGINILSLNSSDTVPLTWSEINPGHRNILLPKGTPESELSESWKEFIADAYNNFPNLNNLPGSAMQFWKKDPDGDGFSNLDEFTSGSDPRDENSIPSNANADESQEGIRTFPELDPIPDAIAVNHINGNISNYTPATPTNSGTIKGFTDPNSANPNIGNISYLNINNNASQYIGLEANEHVVSSSGNNTVLNLSQVIDGSIPLDTWREIIRADLPNAIELNVTMIGFSDTNNTFRNNSDYNLYLNINGFLVPLDENMILLNGTAQTITVSLSGANLAYFSRYMPNQFGLTARASNGVNVTPVRGTVASQLSSGSADITLSMGGVSLAVETNTNTQATLAFASSTLAGSGFATTSSLNYSRMIQTNDTLNMSVICSGQTPYIIAPDTAFYRKWEIKRDGGTWIPVTQQTMLTTDTTTNDQIKDFIKHSHQFTTTGVYSIRLTLKFYYITASGQTSNMELRTYEDRNLLVVVTNAADYGLFSMMFFPPINTQEDFVPSFGNSTMQFAHKKEEESTFNDANNCFLLNLTINTSRTWPDGDGVYSVPETTEASFFEARAGMDNIENIKADLTFKLTRNCGLPMGNTVTSSTITYNIDQVPLVGNNLNLLIWPNIQNPGKYTSAEIVLRGVTCFWRSYNVTESVYFAGSAVSQNPVRTLQGNGNVGLNLYYQDKTPPVVKVPHPDANSSTWDGETQINDGSIPFFATSGESMEVYFSVYDNYSPDESDYDYHKINIVRLAYKMYPAGWNSDITSDCWRYKDFMLSDGIETKVGSGVRYIFKDTLKIPADFATKNFSDPQRKNQFLEFYVITSDYSGNINNGDLGIEDNHLYYDGYNSSGNTTRFKIFVNDNDPPDIFLNFSNIDNGKSFTFEVSGGEYDKGDWLNMGKVDPNTYPSNKIHYGSPIIDYHIKTLEENTPVMLPVVVNEGEFPIVIDPQGYTSAYSSLVSLDEDAQALLMGSVVTNNPVYRFQFEGTGAFIREDLRIQMKVTTKDTVDGITKVFATGIGDNSAFAGINGDDSGKIHYIIFRDPIEDDMEFWTVDKINTYDGCRNMRKISIPIKITDTKFSTSKVE